MKDEIYGPLTYRHPRSTREAFKDAEYANAFEMPTKHPGGWLVYTVVAILVIFLLMGAAK